MIPMARNVFLAALEGRTERIPVWFMRQAGRYLPAYREIRSRKNIQEICKDPKTMADLSYAPVRDIGVDAAIIFYDITLPLQAMDCDVEFVDSVGPIVKTVRKPGEIKKYSKSEDKYALTDGIREFRKSYPGVPIIGFAGGPITLASYVIAGRTDRDLLLTRKKLYEDSAGLHRLLETLNDSILSISKAQTNAGVDAIQIFDSWSGSLSSHEFEDYTREYLKPLFDELSSFTKSIYFASNSGRVLENIATLDVDFVSIDPHTNLTKAYDRLGGGVGIQGNLDSFTAASSAKDALLQTRKILAESKKVDRFIFNLGHGVLPGTPPENLTKVVNEVHSFVR